MLRILLVALCAVSGGARPHAAPAWTVRSSAASTSAVVAAEGDEQVAAGLAGHGRALAIRGGAEVLKMEERSLIGTFCFMLKAFFAVG